MNNAKVFIVKKVILKEVRELKALLKKRNKNISGRKIVLSSDIERDFKFKQGIKKIKCDDIHPFETGEHSNIKNMFSLVIKNKQGLILDFIYMVELKQEILL